MMRVLPVSHHVHDFDRSGTSSPASPVLPQPQELTPAHCSRNSGISGVPNSRAKKPRTAERATAGGSSNRLHLPAGDRSPGKADTAIVNEEVIVIDTPEKEGPGRVTPKVPSNVQRKEIEAPCLKLARGDATRTTKRPSSENSSRRDKRTKRVKYTNTNASAQKAVEVENRESVEEVRNNEQKRVRPRTLRRAPDRGNRRSGKRLRLVRQAQNQKPSVSSRQDPFTD